MTRFTLWPIWLPRNVLQTYWTGGLDELEIWSGPSGGGDKSFSCWESNLGLRTRSQRTIGLCGLARCMPDCTQEHCTLTPTVRMRAELCNNNSIPAPARPARAAGSLPIFPRPSCFTGQRGSMDLLPSTLHLLKHKPYHVIVLPKDAALHPRLC
jgi:hypothetical protein